MPGFSCGKESKNKTDLCGYASCAGRDGPGAIAYAAAKAREVLGNHMYRNGQQCRSGDGIVTKGVEATIRNVGRLGRNRMRETNKESVKTMMNV